jgi:hypothetical protein
MLEAIDVLKGVRWDMRRYTFSGLTLTIGLGI